MPKAEIAPEVACRTGDFVRAAMPETELELPKDAM